MPKLLSRSKHKEFELNSALQIRNQKERRVENARKLGHCKNFVGLRKFRNLQNFTGCENLQSAEFSRLQNFATSQPAKIRSVANLPPLRIVHFSTLLTVPTARLTFSFFVHFLVFFLLSLCNSVWIFSFW